MAENLKKKNNKKIITCFILFLSLLTANFCFAEELKYASDDDTLNNSVKIEGYNKNDFNVQTATDVTEKNTNKAATDNSNNEVKNYAAKFDNVAEKTIDNNLTIMKTVLAIIGVIAAILLFAIFKIASGKKRKGQNPFSKNKTVKKVLKKKKRIKSSEKTGVKSLKKQNNTNSSNIIFEKTVDIKQEIMKEPTPTDLKSAVKLFVKITSK